MPLTRITTSVISDSAVTSAKLAAGAVATTDLADSAVTTAKIADSAITTAKIAAGAVVTADLADAAVTTEKIAAGAVVTVDLADSAVTSVKIADSAITSAKIADGTIVTTDIANSAVTPAKLSQPYTLATAQNSTSGTSIDFTGIPSWVKRVTVMLNNVSKSATGSLLLQLGTSSGIETTGYSSTGTNFTGGVTSTSGFIVADGAAAWLNIGRFTLDHMGSNLWICTHLCSLGSVSATLMIGTGSKTLAAVLDRVRVTSSTGTDTFDAGSINISYEG